MGPVIILISKQVKICYSIRVNDRLTFSAKIYTNHFSSLKHCILIGAFFLAHGLPGNLIKMYF